MENEKYKIATFKKLLSYFSDDLKVELRKIKINDIEMLQEIRLRRNCEIMLKFTTSSFILSKLTEKKIIITDSMLKSIFDKMCDYSIHCRQKEIENGFLTLYNGCRGGIGADFQTDSDGKIKLIKQLYSINIRLAGMYQCDEKILLDKVFKKSGEELSLCGILIAGPPSSGKTTVLRSLARSLATEYDKTIAIIDERKEIYPQIEENFLPMTNIDIISGVSKQKAMEIALRTLSPDVIICDEIGVMEEAESILQLLNGGVCTFASAHGKSIDELQKRPQIKLLIDSGAFDYIVFLKSDKEPGKYKEIINIKE